ncbi:hypothetical protein KM792_11185 [Clostridium tyrobutyricum]|nr:hypothetical protein [Clostridium tyrobutyricum]MBV4427601.1 hypothetical protein [Clostridium tyrobutyricum]MBV4442662.1 hypothetical protein [Clostridium tyrobutyricum]MBV4450212.1 hypothetical protein [Clostridium tyrobutyricum]MCH4238077.1 hypothetical protein [Clostridium tyrobutyricum]MCH4257447.1 hypothetical protein [Clostridium tyrobutyricum]
MKKSVPTKIKKMLNGNNQKLSYFVKWYVDSDRSKESYDKEIKNNCAVEFETAMSDWLMREDVQEAIKAYLKSSQTLKMLDIYNSMYNKATKKGDVNSAKWCEDFFKSDFFGNSEDEIDNYLNGINIPGLKGDNK